MLIRMNKKEVEEFTVMKTDIKHIKKELEENKEINRSAHIEIMQKLDGLDSKFAAKWVEKVQISLIIALITAVIGAVIVLV